MGSDRAFWTRFPPGRYFLGDPGTALREELYHDERLHKRKRHHGTFEHEGLRWAEANAIGDGWYASEPSGWRFAVDAALLGVVPEGLWRPKSRGRLSRVGRIVTAKQGLVFRVGRVRRVGVGEGRTRTLPTRRMSYRVDGKPAEVVEVG